MQSLGSERLNLIKSSGSKLRKIMEVGMKRVENYACTNMKLQLISDLRVSTQNHCILFKFTYLEDGGEVLKRSTEGALVISGFLAVGRNQPLRPPLSSHRSTRQECTPPPPTPTLCNWPSVYVTMPLSQCDGWPTEAVNTARQVHCADWERERELCAEAVGRRKKSRSWEVN